MFQESFWIRTHGTSHLSVSLCPSTNFLSLCRDISCFILLAFLGCTEKEKQKGCMSTLRSGPGDWPETRAPGRTSAFCGRGSGANKGCAARGSRSRSARPGASLARTGIGSPAAPGHCAGQSGRAAAPWTQPRPRPRHAPGPAGPGDQRGLPNPDPKGAIRQTAAGGQDVLRGGWNCLRDGGGAAIPP